MSALERNYTDAAVELRSGTDGKRTIGGYAAVFDRMSKNLGGFVESVGIAAFNKSRGDGWPDVIARHNHDDNMLLGTVAGNTLRLTVDDTGLSYDVDPPEHRGDVVELVSRGDVRKSSFAFRVPAGGDEWERSEQGYPHRRLLAVQLVDVATVNLPAYADSTAGIRAQKRDAALRSLAAKFDADPEEVFEMAEADELRSFFERTDNAGPPKRKPKPHLGAAARMAILARESDPYVEQH